MSFQGMFMRRYFPAIAPSIIAGLGTRQDAVHTRAFSASAANSKKCSTPYSLGPATKPGDLISGKIGNVIPDTQFIDALVKATSLSPGCRLLFAITKNVNNVTQGLQSKGIQVLASSNQEEDSISLAGEIMKDAYAKVKADLATSKANRGIRSKDIKSTLSKQWTTVLDRSRTDLTLACAAHVKGSAFITADQVFAADFGKEAARRGVRIYVVPASWAALRQN
ncbi:hypothetical protein TWF788_008129 [Orbilia oligospora]|uniref:Uncharacterized protein n=1 Tax=Orbilia oligospora TaxID=2813651 RepID=A0A7C8UD40_ORBOL|nr:hypothetical protein TWF788_008129 [Orbilia oligospora]